MAVISEFCILGAGLAGLSLADSLTERDVSTVVIDKSDVASGASGTPGALVNPATGRRATKAWRAESCYKAISDNLEKVAGFIEPGTSFYHNNGLLRPALTGKMARKMKKQYDKTSWPNGWCTWKTESEIKKMHPGIKCVEGGLWLPIGLSVNCKKYLTGYASYLEKHDVKIIQNADVHVQSQGNSWIIDTGKEQVQSKNLVYATGFSTTENPYWNWLPIHPIKGQVAEFELPDGNLSFSHSISSLGYISLVGNKNSFVQGSTYEHDFTDLEADREGVEYLRKRMRRTLPQLEKKVRLKNQWAGVRASTPNKKPVIGSHPEIENLHVFTGLGSKGLLYSKYLAGKLVDHLLESEPVISEVSVGRFNYEKLHSHLKN